MTNLITRILDQFGDKTGLTFVELATLMGILLEGKAAFKIEVFPATPKNEQTIKVSVVMRDDVSFSFTIGDLNAK